MLDFSTLLAAQAPIVSHNTLNVQKSILSQINDLPGHNNQKDGKEVPKLSDSALRFLSNLSPALQKPALAALLEVAVKDKKKSEDKPKEVYLIDKIDSKHGEAEKTGSPTVDNFQKSTTTKPKVIQNSNLEINITRPDDSNHSIKNISISEDDIQFHNILKNEKTNSESRSLKSSHGFNWGNIGTEEDEWNTEFRGNPYENSLSIDRIGKETNVLNAESGIVLLIGIFNLLAVVVYAANRHVTNKPSLPPRVLHWQVQKVLDELVLRVHSSSDATKLITQTINLAQDSPNFTGRLLSSPANSDKLFKGLNKLLANVVSSEAINNSTKLLGGMYRPISALYSRISHDYKTYIAVNSNSSRKHLGRKMKDVKYPIWLQFALEAGKFNSIQWDCVLRTLTMIGNSRSLMASKSTANAIISAILAPDGTARNFSGFDMERLTAALEEKSRKAHKTTPKLKERMKRSNTDRVMRKIGYVEDAGGMIGAGGETGEHWSQRWFSLVTRLAPVALDSTNLYAKANNSPECLRTLLCSINLSWKKVGPLQASLTPLLSVLIGWAFEDKSQHSLGEYLQAIRAGWLERDCSSLYPECEIRVMAADSMLQKALTYFSQLEVSVNEKRQFTMEETTPGFMNYLNDNEIITGSPNNIKHNFEEHIVSYSDNRNFPISTEQPIRPHSFRIRQTHLNQSETNTVNGFNPHSNINLNESEDLDIDSGPKYPEAQHGPERHYVQLGPERHYVQHGPEHHHVQHEPEHHYVQHEPEPSYVQHEAEGPEVLKEPEYPDTQSRLAVNELNVQHIPQVVRNLEQNVPYDKNEDMNFVLGDRDDEKISSYEIYRKEVYGDSFGEVDEITERKDEVGKTTYHLIDADKQIGSSFTSLDNVKPTADEVVKVNKLEDRSGTVFREDFSSSYSPNELEYLQNEYQDNEISYSIPNYTQRLESWNGNNMVERMDRDNHIPSSIDSIENEVDDHEFVFHVAEEMPHETSDSHLIHTFDSPKFDISPVSSTVTNDDRRNAISQRNEDHEYYDIDKKKSHYYFNPNEVKMQNDVLDESREVEKLKALNYVKNIPLNIDGIDISKEILDQKPEIFEYNDELDEIKSIWRNEEESLQHSYHVPSVNDFDDVMPTDAKLKDLPYHLVPRDHMKMADNNQKQPFFNDILPQNIEELNYINLISPDQRRLEYTERELDSEYQYQDNDPEYDYIQYDDWVNQIDDNLEKRKRENRNIMTSYPAENQYEILQQPVGVEESGPKVENHVVDNSELVKPEFGKVESSVKPRIIPKSNRTDNQKQLLYESNYPHLYKIDKSAKDKIVISSPRPRGRKYNHRKLKNDTMPTNNKIVPNIPTEKRDTPPTTIKEEESNKIKNKPEDKSPKFKYGLRRGLPAVTIHNKDGVPITNMKVERRQNKLLSPSLMNWRGRQQQRRRMLKYPSSHSGQSRGRSSGQGRSVVEFGPGDAVTDEIRNMLLFEYVRDQMKN